MPTACIALGSNLGNRKMLLDDARWALSCLPASRLIAFSSIHETDPVGPSGPGKFLNAAAVLLTMLSPQQLLDELLAIEQHAGRQRHERWAPRTLDLDLLLYDDAMIHDKRLTLPHPRMHQRRFVLAPLAEIAPEASHPVLKATIHELLGKLPADAG